MKREITIRKGVGYSSRRDKAGRTLQPVIVAPDGVVRFRENAIVRFLLDNGGWDMNHIARLDFSDEDRAQFAQLIGYSVCGWGELNYVQLAMARHADDIADRLAASK